MDGWFVSPSASNWASLSLCCAPWCYPPPISLTSCLSSARPKSITNDWLCMIRTRRTRSIPICYRRTLRTTCPLRGREERTPLPRWLSARDWATQLLSGHICFLSFWFTFLNMRCSPGVRPLQSLHFSDFFYFLNLFRLYLIFLSLISIFFCLVWSAIGFPITSESARNTFYVYGNWTYQVGVFVSRSSGVLWRADLRTLWLMPTLQAFLLVFFTLDAFYLWWYNWSILVLCFVAGLFGGAVYVGAFSLLAESVAPELKEFSLSASGVAIDIGIAASVVAGIFIERSLYHYHHLSDN